MAKQDVLTIEFDSNDEEFEAYRDEIETLRAKLLACTAVAELFPVTLRRYEVTVSEKCYGSYETIVVEAENATDARNIGRRWHTDGILGTMELTAVETYDIDVEVNFAAADAILSEAR